MNNNPEEAKTPKRIDELYRLRAEHAEHAAATWKKISEVLMEEHQDLAVKVREYHQKQEWFNTEISEGIASMNTFIRDAESVCRRALAVIDGTSTEDKTEVREALEKLLKGSG